MADNVRRKPAQPHAKSEAWLRGPRSLCLKRSEYGFGFTLRHFIVYPPESFSVWEGLGSPRNVDPAQPMDTIFVKQVHADSPAGEAGLSTGDRIVGVNGQNVAGFPYSHVVQLIQHSEGFLRLAVVPREHDLLQLYFGATAHNPETNQRPRVRSPDKQASALPVPVHRIHSATHRQPDNTRHPAKAVKHRQSLDNAPTPRQSLAGPVGSTPRYRNPTRRASEGNPLKREAIYGSYYDNDRLVWDEKRGITREEGPLREEMVVTRGVGCNRPVARMAGTPTDSDMSDSSNSLYYQSGSSVDASRRESTASLDSTSTLTGQDQSSEDSLIMDRIRRSFEQKEEFLRRPNQPILYNLVSGNDGNAESAAAVPPIREFYARPQKLQKPAWPPAPTDRDLSRVRSELDSGRGPPGSSDRTSADPSEHQRRGQFVYGGQVTNVPNSNPNRSAEDAFRPQHPTNTTGAASAPHRQPRHFVTTLPRIHENLPDSPPSPGYSDDASSSPPPAELFARSLSSPTSDNRYAPHSQQVQVVSRRARQFESGRLAEAGRTDLYRSELARLSARRGDPTVALRTREFESRGRHGESRSLEGTDRASLDQPSCARARSNSAESWAAAFGSPRIAPGGGNALDWPLGGREGDEPARHRAVRQDSYLAACNTEPRASRLLKRQGTALDESSEDVPPPPSRPNQEVGSAPAPAPATRPSRLDISVPPSPAQAPPTVAGEGGAIAHTDVESLISALDDATAQGLLSVENAAMPIVVRRQKNVNHHSNMDDDRLRRASYLKATCGERMHVDSDLEYSDTEQQLRSANRKWRPPLFPDDIQQLREIFEEGARPTVSRQPPRDHPTQLATPTQDNKENLSASREGWLHCKITVVDGKRAGDRSWKQVWAVLTDHTLTLYKDRRDPQLSGQTPAGGGEAESVDMCCAQVDKAGDYTKRKHVLRLNTLSCSELLLQAADGEDVANWLTILSQAAKEDCASLKSPPGSARLSPLPNKGIRKLTSFRTRSPTGQSPVNKTLKPSHTEPMAGSPKVKTWKGRVARQFRRIQHGANSPSSPTTDSYPEGSTIGIPLQHCPMSEENELVPFLVAKCTAIVEERGLDIIGIYRVPGNTAAISSLTEAVNKGFQFINFQVGSSSAAASPFECKSSIDPRWSDVNVISSLLKLFFRRLPDALLTSELYPLFIDADKMDDPNNRISSLRKLIHELPDHHFETLKYLLNHLKRVVNHSSVNKMEARNLAIVFGPTLVRTADNNMVTMVTDMSHQCRIVESLLLYSDWFFSEEDEPSGFPFGLSNDATAELEATAINHNQSLLLSNIQKVEGMKSDSTGKDILAKVIGSSIISAANRKMQKTKTRRGEEAREETDRRRRGAASVVGTAASIVESPGAQEAPAEEPSLPAEAEETPQQQQQQQQQEERKVPPDCEDGTIRTYAGLSATTQERIRRFELETKAMLQRDLTRQRDTQQQGKMTENQSDPLRRPAEPTVAASQSPASSRIHLNPIADDRAEGTVHRLTKKQLFSGSVDSRDASVVTHSTVDSLATTEQRESSKKLVCDNSWSDERTTVRRGSSVENLALATESAQPARKTANGTLKRFKTGKEQLAQPSQLMSSLRCGSLDSLQEVFGADRPPSDVSDDGSDLLSSLTSTFDRKLKSLLTTAPAVVPEQEGPVIAASPPKSRIPTYRDPSLHRRASLTRPQVVQGPASAQGDAQASADKQAVRRQWLEAELPLSESTNAQVKLRRAASLTRADAGLTKTEKTESNISKRRQADSKRGAKENVARLKRKNGMPERAIKRRHTVGGTRDFDKVNWLDNRLQEERLESRNAGNPGQKLRTSSPDLSSNRTSAGKGREGFLAALGLLAPDTKDTNIPLESHV